MDENTREILCFDNEKKEQKDYYVTFLNYLSGETDSMSEIDKKIFDENMEQFNSVKATLKDLCYGLGIEVPKKFENIANKRQKIKFRPEYIVKNDVYVVLRTAEEFEMKRTTSKDLYESAINRGAKLIIMSRQEFEKYEMDEEAFPVILIDQLNERILRLFSIVRKQHKEKVVMITGSVGKTTTKELCDVVTKDRFDTFVNMANTNSVHKVANHLFYKVKEDRDVYIQEAGAGYKGSVTLAGAMLQPDIFILTNVYKHHMENYETLANVFADKTGTDEFMPKDGLIITNFDDDNIRNYKFKHKVCSFAVDYEDVDFRAINVRQEKDTLCCDIYERATGKTTEIKVKIVGEHNAYNILAAYALAKTLGVPENQIQEDFLKYRTDGIRQNLMNIGGVHLNVDCYNVAEESIIAMLKTGEKFELETGARRFAIIGGENKLGKEASERSEAFGRKLADIHVDKYLFCGVKAETSAAYNKFGDGKSIQKGFQQVSKIPNSYSWKIPNIVTFLKWNVKRNDLVMIKGIYHLNMTIAVDKVFGTSISFDLPHYRGTAQVLESGKYKASLIPKFKEVEILEAPIADGTLIIPNVIEEYPVFRVKEEAFKNNSKITAINFGDSMKNIGAGAFSECTAIKMLTVPWNIKVIEKEAFKDCVSLEKAALQEGNTHIGEEAFAGCKNLKDIYIPATVGMIEENAFKDCDEIVIRCVKNSFAHKYAMENNLSFSVQRADKNAWKYLLKNQIRKMKRKG